MPNSYPLKVLDQTHPDYETERHFKRDLLFRGGEDIIQNASLFIPKVSDFELDEAYDQKLACASYTNLFGSVINFYVSQVFDDKKLSLQPQGGGKPHPFYTDFGRDADQGGTPFVSVVKELLTDLITHKTAIIGVDTPAIPGENLSLLDEEASGADRAYLVRIPHASLIDWELDERGLFKWCRLKTVFPKPVGPYGSRKMIVSQWKTWMMGENGKARWEVCEREGKEGELLGGNVSVSVVSEGETSFDQIPVLRFQLPDGLFLGGKIATKCADHFRMQSSLFYAQHRSLYAVPYYVPGVVPAGSQTVFDQGDTEETAESAATQALNRGFMVLRANDKVGFLEPSGAAYSLSNQQLKEMQDDVLRMGNQMAQSVSATTQQSARSAASKVVDNHATEVILSEYGQAAMQLATRIYELVSQVRRDGVAWEAKGLADYKIVDRADLISEALTISQVTSSIPSREFQRLYMTETALAVLRKVSHESEQLIVQEITDAIASQLPEAHPPEEEDDVDDANEEGDPDGDEDPSGAD